MIQNLFAALPELSHVEIMGKVPVYTTIQGTSGTITRLKSVDLEARTSQSVYGQYEELLKQLPPSILARFYLRDQWSHECVKEGLSRSESIRSIGFRKKDLLLSIEWKTGTSVSVESLPLQVIESIGTPLTENEIKAELLLPDAEISAKGSILDFGDRIKGIYRIYKQGVDAISEVSLPSLLSEIDADCDVIVSLKKVDQAKATTKLQHISTKAKMGNRVFSSEKVSAAEDALKSVSLYGEAVFEVEWLVCVEGKTEEELRGRLSTIKSTLSKFGHGSIETFGAYRSYVASRIGSGRQHVTFLEQSPTVSYFLPVCFYGAPNALGNCAETSLLLHRDDGSLHAFDQFQKGFTSFNMVISGKTGSGKSVFGNMCSQALLTDPNLHMTKVDVGGSYRRECEQYGGLEICFNLNEPSGMDPFRFIDPEMGINDTVSVLTEFLCALSLEEGEAVIQREMKADFESAIRSYIEESQAPSFNLFLEAYPNLPRLKLLKRWDKNGQYENVLMTDGLQDFTNRYLYFNFENILNAANPEYVSGVMAAVIAKVNIDLLRLSLPKNRELGKRLVFFCDETKFFLEKNGQFFLLTSANFRKFGHANILAGQNIRDFVLNINGREDHGLILNSPIRVFFEAGVDPEFLRNTFSFSEREIELVRTSANQKGYRQFILQDDEGTRLLKLMLTKNEYLSVTSSRHEVDKINHIRSVFPELNVNEVIGLIQMGGMV